MKRAALEDPGDRAQTRRKLGNVRIPLEQIGFHEENRGGLGISPHHAHEVCWDQIRAQSRATAAAGSQPIVRPVPAQAAAAASSMDPSCSQLERWLLMYSSGG